MMDLPPNLPAHDAPAIEWLHVMPPADSADLVIGYESAYPFLHLPTASASLERGADHTGAAPAP